MDIGAPEPTLPPAGYAAGPSADRRSPPRCHTVYSGPMPPSHSRFPNLTVLEHPLIQHKLSILRDKRTSVKDFKQLVSEIAMLMTYEVTRHLETERSEERRVGKECR